MAGKQLIPVEGALHQFKPLCFGKIDGIAFFSPGAGDGIMMQIESIHMISRPLHHHLRPLKVISRGTGSDTEWLNVAHRMQKSGELPVLVSIIFRSHVTTTAPAFVTHSPEAHIPGIRPAMLLTQIRHGSGSGMVHVFPPPGHLLYRSATDITHNDSFGVQLPHQVHKLMRTNGIIVHHATPKGIDDLRTLLLWTDSVFPEVVVSKTSARPPKIGNPDSFQSLHNILADPVLAVLILLPDPIVDSTAKMLRKMAINMFIDSLLWLIGLNNHMVSRLRLSC